MRVLTTRGRLALLAALALYLVGWGFGMEEAFPVAVGLALAVLAAGAWGRLMARPLELARRLPAERTEGAPLDIGLELRPLGGFAPPRALAVDRAGELGEPAVVLRRREGVLRGGYRLAAVPRGR